MNYFNLPNLFFLATLTLGGYLLGGSVNGALWGLFVGMCTTVLVDIFL